MYEVQFDTADKVNWNAVYSNQTGFMDRKSRGQHYNSIDSRRAPGENYLCHIFTAKWTCFRNLNYAKMYANRSPLVGTQDGSASKWVSRPCPLRKIMFMLSLHSHCGDSYQVNSSVPLSRLVREKEVAYMLQAQTA